MLMRKSVLTLLAVSATLQFAAGAVARDYPSRPITIVVPYTAGGSSDTITRIVAERMRATLGQPVIIDNIGGAAGRIGTGRVARAAHDGYTLVAGSTSTHVVNSAVFALNYDVVNDFEPVLLLVETPYLIVARKTSPARNLKELIAWLKENGDKASQGTTGVGGTSHLAGMLFQKQTGTRFQSVPYRGSAMQDLVAGNVDLMFDMALNSIPQLRSGTIKVFAVAARSRLAQLPDIPTAEEAGLPEFEVSHFHALFAPKGTPKTVVAKLNAASVEALADPAVHRRLTDLGLEIFPRDMQTPEALRAYHKTEIEKWWPIIKAAGIKAE
jgi:tripartite-type tricarboxylate transporter receptor subunit TctC